MESSSATIEKACCGSDRCRLHATSAWAPTNPSFFHLQHACTAFCGGKQHAAMNLTEMKGGLTIVCNSDWRLVSLVRLLSNFQLELHPLHKHQDNFTFKSENVT